MKSEIISTNRKLTLKVNATKLKSTFQIISKKFSREKMPITSPYSLLSQKARSHLDREAGIIRVVFLTRVKNQIHNKSQVDRVPLCEEKTWDASVIH